MAFSWQESVKPAGTQDIQCDIEYLDKSYIHVYLDGAETTAFTWTSSTNIRLNSPLSAETVVLLIRKTEREYLYIEFASGAPFIEGNVDTQNTQFLHLAQELVEGRSIEGFYGDINMHRYRITNLGDPVDARDAANKQYVDAGDARLDQRIDAEHAAWVAAVASEASIRKAADDALDVRTTNLEQTYFNANTNSFPWWTVLTTATDTVIPGIPFSKAKVRLNGVTQTAGYSYTVNAGVVKFAEVLPVGTLVDMTIGIDTEADTSAVSTVMGVLAAPTGAGYIGLAPGGTVAGAISYVFPEQFNVDYNDATAGLQAAINYAVANGIRLVATNRKFIIKSQLKIPTQLNADFTGSEILADPSITSGAAVLVDGKGSVVLSQYAGTIHNLCVRRALVDGHADTASLVDGISFGGASGQASDMRWYNMQVYGFRDGVRFDGPNTYLNHFLLPRIGYHHRRGVAVYASVNSNENHGFIGGSIFNVNNTSFNGVGLYVDSGASDTELYLSHCSIDYCDESVNLRLGRLNLNSCHLENNNNNPHIRLQYTAGKERPTVIVNGGMMAGGPGVTSWTGIPPESDGGRPALIYVHAAGSVHIHLYGCKVGDYEAGVVRNTQIVQVENNNPDVLASFVCHPLIDAGNSDSGSRPLRICDALNLLYVNAYNLNSWTQSVSRDDGTITFTAEPTVSQDPAYPGARKYVGTAGFSTSIYQTINCFAGEMFNFHAFIKVESISAGYAALRVDFLDAKGNVINSEQKQVSAVTSGWQQLWVFKKVPNGAITCRVQEYYNSFTGVAYFSRESLWRH